MDMSDPLTLVLVVLGVVALLGVGVSGFVMWRYRVPPRGLTAMIGSLVYLASPVDVLPEVMLGPLGLLDDAGAVTAAGVFVYKLVRVKRRLEDAGRGLKLPQRRRTRFLRLFCRILSVWRAGVATAPSMVRSGSRLIQTG